MAVVNRDKGPKPIRTMYCISFICPNCKTSNGVEIPLGQDVLTYKKDTPSCICYYCKIEFKLETIEWNIYKEDLSSYA